MFRISCLLALLIVVTPFVLVIGSLLLVFKGTPGACGGGKPLQNDPKLSLAFDQGWQAFNQQLTSGQPATISVSDGQATSRSRQFLLETGAPVRNLRLCFVPGGGDLNATLSPPFGPDVSVRVKGSVVLGGRHPQTRIDDVQIGAMPSFVTRPFRGLVTRIIDDQTQQIELDHRLSVDLREGEAVITGAP